jgi:rhamnosyltransferase
VLPELSLIIRARDEEESLGRCLERIRAQDADGAAVEVIVVDSGSVDNTRAIARTHGARLVDMPPESFTFGGALNLGAANARGAVLVALSAHAFLPDPQWLSRVREAMSGPQIACATGDRFDPDGGRLEARIEQDEALARRRPEWGYSNAAGAFRAELWRRRPFREDLPACEDKEWAWHWLARGYRCTIDPGLRVEHDHTHDSVRSIYTRARREAAAYTEFLPWRPPADGPGALVREWWSDLRWYPSPARARLSHRRAARLLGAYAGRRAAVLDHPDR